MNIQSEENIGTEITIILKANLQNLADKSIEY
jgi:hypothetical protein